MPPVTPTVLIGAFLDGFQQSGGTGYFISNDVQAHPREFIVEHSGRRFSAWVYAWNVTHGGRETLPDEYRIQMTSVNSPLALNQRCCMDRSGDGIPPFPKP